MELSNAVWTAAALVLVIEGFLPFVSPAAWRRMFMQMLQLQDGQIRFFALLCIAAGLTMLLLG
jgi:uncharacterized protein YjeT (DUF2065 family)